MCLYFSWVLFSACFGKPTPFVGRVSVRSAASGSLISLRPKVPVRLLDKRLIRAHCIWLKDSGLGTRFVFCFTHVRHAEIGSWQESFAVGEIVSSKEWYCKACEDTKLDA